MSHKRDGSNSSMHLEIPHRDNNELNDPGAHEMSSDEEYFSDASEGHKKISRPVTPSSPIPVTRVEKVDDEPRHGEVPGTPAYDKRRQDAVPDEIEVVPDGSLSKRSSRQFLETPLTPGGTPIPRTVVEKIDPDTPSHGEVPGTDAYLQRMSDATPDVILRNPDPSHGSKYDLDTSNMPHSPTIPIPETVVTRADDELAHGEVPGTAAAELRKRDAAPDKLEIERDEPATIEHGIPSPNSQTFSRTNSDRHNDIDHGGDFGDDFDDFEEGAQTGADDDFGDFDDFEQGVQEDTTTPIHSLKEQDFIPTFPLVDFTTLSDLPDLLETTKRQLDAMFPSTTTTDDNENSQSDSVLSESTLFPTDRSRSLWTQLITPPPLQPSNWTQSRIRRLFLISLGVPVDLDEILPPSKQKKLVLPDISFPSSTAPSDELNTSRGEPDSVARLRNSDVNASTASIDSAGSGSATPKGAAARGRPRPTSMKLGHPPPPLLDLNIVRRICATTDEKLEGLTDDELEAHVAELKELEGKTAQLLEYWLKRRDGLKTEKEAFEGVIENLVRHAKRVRTIK